MRFFLMYRYSKLKMRNLIRPLRLTRGAQLFTRNAFAMTFVKPKNTYYQAPSYALTTPLVYGLSQAAPQHKSVIKSSYQANGYYMQQILTGCLAIYSYYIESGDECIIIDPLFDIDHYNTLIKSRGKKLKAIFSSHYHADYVSGQYELQKKHGCKIYMGPKANATENIVVLKDKETIPLGKVKLECWHTPGHTEESSCLVVIDENGKRDTIFTGDTVFLNEVGRPDLAVKTDLTAEDLAKLLYESISKLKTLNDDIRIYPGHGSGSSCGKSIGKGDFCTLGKQKQNNYALKAANKEDFVKQVLQDMPNPPSYFGYNAKLNKFEPFFHEEAAKNGQKHLGIDEVSSLLKEKDVILLDVRKPEELQKGIIKNSICVGFDGAFANWIGTLFSPSQRFVIYGSADEAKDSITRLFRIGYINIEGHASFSIEDWKNKNLPLTTPDFVEDIIEPNTTVLDVRKPNEWKNEGIVEGAETYELTDIFRNPQKLDKSKTYITHCRGGFRARIAWSFLIASGFKAKAFPYSFEEIFEKSKTAKKVPYQK